MMEVWTGYNVIEGKGNVNELQKAETNRRFMSVIGISNVQQNLVMYESITRGCVRNKVPTSQMITVGIKNIK